MRCCIAAVCLIALGHEPAEAQRFPLLSEPAPSHELVCADTAAPRAAATDDPEVERLTDAATQAMILGDFEGALSFLDRAVGIDAGAPEPSWLRARVLYQAGRTHEATVAFCRFLALAPVGAPADEARTRLEEARTADPAVAAIEADFSVGVEEYERGLLAEAESTFSRVLVVRPSAASAIYNRAVVRLARESFAGARADLERYRVITRPLDEDSIRIQRMIDWASASIAGPTPGAAFGLGFLVPGGGQFYTRRPAWGTLTMGASAGLVAAGILVQRTRVTCLQPDPDGGCPPDQIASEETERPLLLPAIGAAAVLWLGAAIEAALHARGERTAPGVDARLEGPRVQLHLYADMAEVRVTVPTGSRR